MKHSTNSNILGELKKHIPFTLAAVLISLILVSFLLINQNLMRYAVVSFEIFHPLHIFFSAIVSAAIFYNYKKNIFWAILSGVLITLVIGSLSDAIFPYLGSLLFYIPISFHFPLLEYPVLILGAGIFGAVAGIITRRTKFPHFLHVLLSVLASLLYIFSYSTNFPPIVLFFMFIITSISVIIPCCLSDIVFPLLWEQRMK